MNLRLTLVGLAWLSVAGAVWAQDAQPMKRKLAPGVVTVIPIAPQEDETFDGPLPLVEIVDGIDGLDWTPHFASKTDTLLEKSKIVVLRRAIWNLEFAFKPMRRIEVDIPQATGKMQRKKVWYMVYRVQNIGQDSKPKVSGEFETDPERSPETYKTERVTHAKLRFFPHFVFSGRVYEQDKYVVKDYLDRIIPAAQKPIQDRETPGAKLYNTVEITRVPILLSDDKIDRSVWGRRDVGRHRSADRFLLGTGRASAPCCCTARSCRTRRCARADACD